MTTVTETRPRTNANGDARALRADARRNHEAILTAAKRLFADQGIEAQMPDIAKAAKVGVGTVYRHFPTKDDLIAALAGDRFERMAEKAEEALEAKDPWEGFCGFIRFAVQIQADDRGLCDVMGSRPDVMGGAAEAAGLDVLIDRLVKRVQRSGDLRPDLDWQDIPMISCALGGATKPKGPGVARWPRMVEIVIDGLRAPGSTKLPKPQT
jgi:AcrR family transcriptional regulator